jgi:hypothetical protein
MPVIISRTDRDDGHLGRYGFEKLRGRGGVAAVMTHFQDIGFQIIAFGQHLLFGFSFSIARE